MSFQKYLQTISRIDTGKIYVENIRSVMNISTSKAKVFAEMAVRENIFVRKIGLICPNDKRILAEYNNESEIPAQIECDICEAEDREHVFNTGSLERMIFYKLKK